jgi:PAS domain S-box-containing protein
VATPQDRQDGPSFLAGGGELGRLMREVDWSGSPAGPPELWPDAIKAAVGICLTSAVPIIIWLGTRHDTIVQLYNDAYRPVMGSAKHPSGLGQLGLRNWPEIWDIMGPIFDEVLTSGHSVRHVDQPMVVNRNGFPEQTWFTHAHSPIREADGAIVGVFTVVTETTEKMVAEARRLQAEAALARSEALARAGAEHLAGIYDAAPVGLCVLDRDLRFVRVNRRLAEMNGISVQDHLGRSVGEIVPSIADQARALMDRVLAGNAVWSATVTGSTSAEPQRNAAWRENWVPLRDGDGMVVGAAVSAEDVTGEHHAQDALRASEARLQLALQAADLTTWEVDLTTNLATRSLRHDQMFGYQVLQSEWGEAIARRHVLEEDLPRFDEAMDRARSTGLMHFEFRVRHPDGSIHWLAPYGRTEYGPDGQPRRMIGVIQDVTARKSAEAEVERSNALVRGIFDSDLLGLTIYDAWGDQTLAVNDCLLRMTGHTRADFDEGRWDWHDITPAEFLPRDESAIAQARELGRWAPYEKEYRRLDGTRFPVRISSAPLPGMPGRVVVSIEDISASRAAEQELRRSEQRLQLAKQAGGIGVWDWNLGSGEISWSPEMFKVLGIPADTPPGQLFAAWEKVLHPEDRAPSLALVSSGAATGEPFSRDFRVVGDDGEIRWVRTQAIALHDDDGRPIRLTGVNIDVTAQHRLEIELRQNAEKLAAEVAERRRERNRIFELSNELFAVIGYDGFLKSVNPAFVRLVGRSEEELLARPYADLIHPEDRADAIAAMAAFERNESLQHFEHRLVTSEGRAVWTRWSAMPDSDHAYAVGRDVTREREQEDTLRQAQKMEAVGQLTGGIAHDFNNLLGAMVGAFDLIRRKPNDVDRVRRFSDLGLQAAERGAKLTGQLLSFSRTQRLELKRVLPGRLVEHMGDLLQRTLGPMITVNLALPEPQLAVTSDPTQLELAVLNLAINARDAMPEGGTLTIATKTTTVVRDAELEPGEYVVLAIADTGHGMPREVLARAFDPFFTTKGVGAGTGLGLSQVYGFARQLGGTARIESELGRGTIVRIYMPRSDGPTGDEALPAPAETADPRPASILLVDDDAEMREVLASSLEALGHRVVVARGGEQGLDLLTATRPDLLIVDFAMPGLTGVDVAERARRTHPDLPIMFVSGYADTEKLERVAGPEGPILRKPYRLEELRSVLSSILPPAD